uniref:Uncharacterized protein n=1 Tax=Panagrolaimus sp. PS1159 TaxID=55785 RepID=A0AC35G0K4_9BILA
MSSENINTPQSDNIEVTTDESAKSDVDNCANTLSENAFETINSAAVELVKEVEDTKNVKENEAKAVEPENTSENGNCGINELVQEVKDNIEDKAKIIKEIAENLVEADEVLANNSEATSETANIDLSDAQAAILEDDFSELNIADNNGDDDLEADFILDDTTETFNYKFRIPYEKEQAELCAHPDFTNEKVIALLTENSDNMTPEQLNLLEHFRVCLIRREYRKDTLAAKVLQNMRKIQIEQEEKIEEVEKQFQNRMQKLDNQYWKINSRLEEEQNDLYASDDEIDDD